MAVASKPEAVETFDASEFTDFAHAGPGTLMGRYLRRFWQPVYVGEELPRGTAKPIRIMGEDFTLYRGEGGEPHLLAFRCAHRGTQLSTGWVEGDDLRCFYHGWKYDGNGQCIEQPAEPEPFCQRIRIRGYPVEEYIGFIFAFLGDGELPAMHRFPNFEDDAPGVREGVRELHSYSWPCSWQNSIENDPVHVLFVHRGTSQAAGRKGYPTITCEETDVGFDMTQVYPNGLTTVTHHLMPNVGHNTGRLSVSGAREAVFWRLPVDDTNFASFTVHLTHITGEEKAAYLAEIRAEEERSRQGTPATELAEAVLRGEFRIEDIPNLEDDHTRLFNVQDYTSQLGQGRMIDQTTEHLGRTDTPVIMRRRLWERELRAMAEGRPLKQWIQQPATH